MDSDYSFVWVLLIALIGIAISIYSLCKGCRGYSERGISARALVAPYAGLLQQMRAEAVNRANFFSISGNAVGDKNPPSYDELFAAPPPSYEDSVRMLKGGFSVADKANNNDKESAQSEDKKENCAKENDSLQVQSTVEMGHSASYASTGAEHVTVVVQEESDELARRHDSPHLAAEAVIHTTPVVLDIETQKDIASCRPEDAATILQAHCV